MVSLLLHSKNFDYIKPTNCDGIGLYRTEITFMSSEKMPDIKKQVECYKKLYDTAGNKKIIFRSLDVGSDKLLPYWNSITEENPAIGWRSIRITLDRRAILRKQMRAFIMAASIFLRFRIIPLLSIRFLILVSLYSLIIDTKFYSHSISLHFDKISYFKLCPMSCKEY